MSYRDKHLMLSLQMVKVEVTLQPFRKAGTRLCLRH